MIRKVLFQNIPLGYLIGALVGAFIGFLMMMLTLNAWSMYNSLMGENEAGGKQYVTINKKLNLLNTFSKNLSSFSDDEIKAIEKSGFAEEVSFFTRSVFQVEASRKASSRMPYMRTEMFFEAVPDHFLDYKPKDWSWKQGQERLPIIIPKEYLNLYNFGFAKAQGLPNVSEELVGQFTFDIVLYRYGKTEVFKGYIAGFTNRLETLLVPQSFIDEANKRFGASEPPAPERLIIRLKPNKEKELYAFLNQQGFETTHDAFQGGKVALLIHLSGAVLLLIATIILLLSLFVYALSMQLTVQRNKEEIYQLILLGYKPAFIWRVYSVFQILSSLVILIISSVVVGYITNLSVSILNDYYITLPDFSQSFTLIVAFGVSVVFVAIISLNTNRLIRKLAAKGTV